MLVASVGYTPINPNGIEIQSDKGIEITPNRNAFPIVLSVLVIFYPCDICNIQGLPQGVGRLKEL